MPTTLNEWQCELCNGLIMTVIRCYCAPCSTYHNLCLDCAAAGARAAGTFRDAVQEEIDFLRRETRESPRLGIFSLVGEAEFRLLEHSR